MILKGAQRNKFLECALNGTKEEFSKFITKYEFTASDIIAMADQYGRNALMLASYSKKDLYDKVYALTLEITDKDPDNYKKLLIKEDIAGNNILHHVARDKTTFEVLTIFFDHARLPVASKNKLGKVPSDYTSSEVPIISKNKKINQQKRITLQNSLVKAIEEKKDVAKHLDALSNNCKLTGENLGEILDITKDSKGYPVLYLARNNKNARKLLTDAGSSLKKAKTDGGKTVEELITTEEKHLIAPLKRTLNRNDTQKINTLFTKINDYCLRRGTNIVALLNKYESSRQIIADDFIQFKYFDLLSKYKLSNSPKWTKTLLKARDSELSSQNLGKKVYIELLEVNKTKDIAKFSENLRDMHAQSIVADIQPLFAEHLSKFNCPDVPLLYLAIDKDIELGTNITETLLSYGVDPSKVECSLGIKAQYGVVSIGKVKSLLIDKKNKATIKAVSLSTETFEKIKDLQKLEEKGDLSTVEKEQKLKDEIKILKAKSDQAFEEVGKMHKDLELMQKVTPLTAKRIKLLREALENVQKNADVKSIEHASISEFSDIIGELFPEEHPVATQYADAIYQLTNDDALKAKTIELMTPPNFDINTGNIDEFTQSLPNNLGITTDPEKAFKIIEVMDQVTNSLSDKSFEKIESLPTKQLQDIAESYVGEVWEQTHNPIMTMQATDDIVFATEYAGLICRKITEPENGQQASLKTLGQQESLKTFMQTSAAQVFTQTQDISAVKAVSTKIAEDYKSNKFKDHIPGERASEQYVDKFLKDLSKGKDKAHPTERHR